MVTYGLEKVADLLVDVLAEAGVRRFAQWDYGLDSGKEHVRHEETTAFVYGAEEHLTRRLAVCVGSCGLG